MSWLFIINLLTSILIVFLFILITNIKSSPLSSSSSSSINYNDHQPLNEHHQYHQQQQQNNAPHIDWNFLERLNQTSAKLILQNEIENLKRLFPFSSNFHHLNNSLTDNDNIEMNKLNHHHHHHHHHQLFESNNLLLNNNFDNNEKNQNNDKDNDDNDEEPKKFKFNLNGIVFLCSMFFILVLITLYLINSWSTRLDRRASIQTKTANNQKQPYTISV